MWNRFYSTKYYRKISVSYHASLKKNLKVPRFYSNHLVCSILNAFTFENLLNYRQLRFLFWLRKCQSPCFYLHKTYFLYNSTFAHRIFKVWQEKYSVCNIYENDVHALIARIFYVQCREPSSMYFM